MSRLTVGFVVMATTTIMSFQTDATLFGGLGHHGGNQRPPGNDHRPPGNGQGPPGNGAGPHGNDHRPPGNGQGPPGNVAGPHVNEQGHHGNEQGHHGNEQGHHGNDHGHHGGNQGHGGNGNGCNDERHGSHGGGHGSHGGGHGHHGNEHGPHDGNGNGCNGNEQERPTNPPKPTTPNPPKPTTPSPPKPTTPKPPAATTTPKPCPALADIFFLIDSSGSLGPVNYGKEQEFAVDISKRFPIGPNGARFGCVIFSSDSQVVFRLSDDLNQPALEKALKGLPYLNTTTHTFKAFDLVYDEELLSARSGGRNNAAKIIIFLTDGFSSDPERTAAAAKRVKDERVSIISIGIGAYSLDELKSVASDDKNVFTASSFLALDLIEQEVAERACQVPSEGRKFQVARNN